MSFSSNQNYCLTKVINQAELFGKFKHQRSKLDLIEEDKFVGQVFKRVEINLPNTTTYLCTFSADGRYVASNHNDNKIYILDLQTAKIVNVLDGHTRCAWSLDFHPVHNHILASGCLNGKVKVWDLKNNAFQEWKNDLTNSNHQVVSSLCFHPFQDLLCIAINNQIHFWNWRTNNLKDQITLCTGDIRQKVRLVKFDKKGRLIVGISNDLYLKDNVRINNLLYNLSNISNLSTGSSSNDSSGGSLSNESSESSYLNLTNLRHRILLSRQRVRTNEETVQQQSVANFSVPEALFSLSNTLTDSIAQDHLLPDNLPSFSFLQNNYQTRNIPTTSLNNVMSIYRRLENEMNNELGNEFNNANQSNNRNQSSNQLNNEQNNSTPINDEELNVIIESTNLIERFISRYNRTMQEEGNSSSEVHTNINYVNLLPRRHRDYVFRRRLSSNRATLMELVRPASNHSNNDRTSLSYLNSVNNLTNSPSESANLIDQINNDNNNSSNNLRSQSLQQNSTPLVDLLFMNRNSNLLSNNLGNSSFEPHRSNHERFYSALSLLQGQNFRTFGTTSLSPSGSNSSSFSSSGSFHQFSRIQPDTPTSGHMSSLINRIQNSINIINRQASSLLANEEVQQLNSNGNLVMQRLICYTNYREKLVNLKNIIRLMISESINVNNVLRTELNHYLQLVMMLITFTDQMLRILVTDLKFTLLSRLYLMRTASNNQNRRNFNSNSIIDLSLNNESSNDSTISLSSTNSSSLSSLNLPSTSSSSNNHEIEEADLSTPSTSSGVTTKSKSKRKLLKDEITSRNKKFKIPIFKISNNDSSDEFTNQTNDEATSGGGNNNNNLSANQNELTNSNNLLRNEMNSLLTNLEQLNERLSGQNRTIYPLNSLNNSIPITRINNPLFSNLNNNFNDNTINVIIQEAPSPQWYNDFSQFSSNNLNLNYRIQCFDFDQKGLLPNLKNPNSNVVVSKCKIHNNSSVDTSKSGDLLACLVPIEGKVYNIDLILNIIEIT